MVVMELEMRRVRDNSPIEQESPEQRMALERTTPNHCCHTMQKWEFR